uniref:Si:dkey-4e7.3 n=1 Tax=Electrophorus electricus TaxID=8005 RepID=A0A4W4E5Y7_ELEEL
TAKAELLVDADCGVDDAQTAMMALAVPNMQILGIARVHGNTTVENVCKTSYACCMLIPVFTGASKALLGNAINAEHFHGQDGLGDAPDTNARSRQHYNMRLHSTERLPLPHLHYQLGVHVSQEIPLGKGCWAPLTECRMYIVPTNLFTLILQAFCDDWLAQGMHKAGFMKLNLPGQHRRQGLISCDSCAMAAAIDDTFITESDRKAAAVGLSGTYSRGMMIEDHLEILKKTQSLHYAKSGLGEV